MENKEIMSVDIVPEVVDLSADPVLPQTEVQPITDRPAPILSITTDSDSDSDSDGWMFAKTVIVPVIS